MIAFSIGSWTSGLPSWSGAYLMAIAVMFLAGRLMATPGPGSGIADGGLAPPASSVLGALVLAVTAAVLVSGALTLLSAVTLGGATLVAAGSHRAPNSRRAGNASRHLLPALAAIAAVAAGARLGATGSAALDGALALVWITAMTAEVRVLARRGQDELVCTTVALGAGGVMVLAAFGGQQSVAALAAGTAGASLSVLGLRATRNMRLGDPGRLFLGFVASVLVLEAMPASGPPTTLVLALLLLAVPLLDQAIASLSRLRRGRLTETRRGGHLLRRLAVRGIPPAASTGALVGCQAVLVVTAVLVGRGDITLLSAVAVAVAVLGGLCAVVLPARIYPQGPVGLPRRVRIVALAALAVPLGLALPAVVTLVRLRGSLESGTAAAEAGLTAARQGDAPGAAVQFQLAAETFSTAGDRLSKPLPSMGLAVPVLSTNLRAARALIDGGAALSAAGQRVVTATDLDRLRVRQGQLPVDELAQLAPTLRSATQALQEVAARIAEADGPYLVPVVRRSAEALEARVRTAIGETEVAAEAARVAPAILGAHGTRRYFLAVQNNAEARATGGLIGSFGEVVFEGGRLRIERFERQQDLNQTSTKTPRQLRAPPDFVERYARFDPANVWQNVNMSPDFPTVARLIADLYPQSGGRPVDGVISIDPPGLAALLELTGPVRVKGWPKPIDASNIVDVTMRDAYESFAKPERIDFLGEVATAVTGKLTSVDLGDPNRLGRVLGEAVRRGHLMLYLANADEQRVITRLGMAGEVGPSVGDSIMLVTQNAGENKVDYYLKRRLRYSVRLSPSSARAALDASLEIVLDNRAPSSGLDPYVIGPNRPRLLAGESYTWLSIYSPLRINRARFDGSPVVLASMRELGRPVYSRFFRIPAMSTRTLALEMAGSVPLQAGGWYSLEFLRQPLLAADDVEVDIEVPAGWRVVETVGLQAGGPGALGTLKLDSNQTVRVRLERASD